MGSLLAAAETETLQRPQGEPEQLECETIDLSKSKDPMVIFSAWLDEARNQPDLNILPETLTLCTVKEDGGPTARSLLLRGFDDEGFKMYWDKRSPKTAEMKLDARGSIVFVWHIRDVDGSQGLRQARIEGIIGELPADEVTAYFEAEPLMAKIRATACHQSRVVKDDRATLKAEIQRIWEDVHTGKLTLRKPSSFQGYVLRPSMIEFYKGKKDSINDRIRFWRKENDDEDLCEGENGWKYERLEP